MSSLSLPESLQPWREWLDCFAPDLAPEIGELLRRLHPLLGRFQGRSSGGDPEPEGLGDLTRRGPYDRLLGSEWLLAEEVPDEFLRRAAVGEHLFLAPRPRARKAERLIVALFDAGPLQLGAPRLAHLALWILLARRAREAGGVLLWGALQGDAFQTADDGIDALKRLLYARTYRMADDAGREAWMHRLQALDTPPGECWLIGDHWDGEGPISHRVSVRSSLDGDSLEVGIDHALSRRQLELPLPGGAIAARLLRGDFLIPEPTAAEHQNSADRLASSVAPLLSAMSPHVAVPLLDERGFMVFHIPKEASQSAKPRKHRGSGPPLAAAFHGKRLGAVTDMSERLHFWQMDDFGHVPRPPRDEFEASAGSARLLPGVWLRDHQSQWFYMVDKAGRLHRWHTAKNHATVHDLKAEHVELLVQLNGIALVYVLWEEGRLCLRHHTVRETFGAPPSFELSLAGTASATMRKGPGTAVLFGGGQGWVRSDAVCAVRLAHEPGETWRIYRQSKMWSEPMDIVVPVGWRAIGVIADTKGPHGFGLLLVGPQRNAIALFNGSSSEALYMTAHPILRSSVCPVHGLVALMTEDKELIVYSPHERAVRLFVHGRGGADDAAA